jgi:hypothetical protein
MGFPLQLNAPKCLAPDGRNLAIGAFQWVTPAGNWFRTGIFAQDSVDGWVAIDGISLYVNAGDLLADVAAHGGIGGYMEWFVSVVNTKLAAMYQAAPPPAEPTNDDEAIAAIAYHLHAMVFEVVNGIPRLHK